MKRILVIQLERLGDLIQTTPLLMDLHRADPEATIDILAWTEFAPIIEGLPGVTSRTLPSRRVKELNDEIENARSLGREPQQAPLAEKELGLPSYDRVINVSHGLFSSWLSPRLNARVIEGGHLNAAGEWLYGGDWLTYLVALVGIRRENHFNIVDLYRGCAAASPPPIDAHAYVACAGSLPFELPEGRLAVLAPGANEEHRRFNSAHTLQLISQLDAMRFKTVLVGGSADAPFVNSLAAAAPVPVTDLSGKTTVQQLAEILRRSQIVVAADSGPAHMAAALERPLVGLYGASLAPLTTAPWGTGHLVLMADSMDAFSCDTVMAAVRTRLGLTDGGDLRRETHAAGIEAWRTAMLPSGADPLGGVTYLPLHTDRLGGADILRRLMRHVMASVITGKEAGDMAHLASLAPSDAPSDLGPNGSIARYEQQLRELAAGVARGLTQFRRRRLDGLSGLSERVAGTIEQLRHEGLENPAIAPAMLFLDWKLRMMPQYGIERVFQENERELKRAAKALRMVREAAAKIWPGETEHRVEANRTNP